MLDFYRNSFIVKLNLRIVIAFAIVMGVIAYISISKMKSAAENQVKQLTQISSNNLINKINEDLIAITNITKSLGNEVTIKLTNARFADSDFEIFGKTILENTQGLLSIAVVFEPNNFFFSNNNDKNKGNNKSKGFANYRTHNNKIVSHIDFKNDTVNYYSNAFSWYVEVKERQQPVWSEPYYSDIIPGNPPVISYSIPLYVYKLNGHNYHYSAIDDNYDIIEREKIFIGVISLSMALSHLNTILDYYYVGPNSYNTLVSKEGIFAVHPLQKIMMSSSIYGSNNLENENSPSQKNIKMLINGDTNFILLDTLGDFICKDSYIYASNIDIIGWKLLVIFHKSFFNSELKNLSLYSTTIYIIFTLLLFVLISFILTQSTWQFKIIQKSLNENKLLDISDWNFPVTESKDDLNQLFQILNYITEKYRTLEKLYLDTSIQLMNADNKITDYEKLSEKAIEEKTFDLNYKNRSLEKMLSNITELNELGKIIAGTLSFDKITSSIYQRLKMLIPIDIFTILTYDEKENVLCCDHGITNGYKIEPFKISILDKTHIAVKCFDIKQKIIINNLDLEYQNYVLMKPYSPFEKEIVSLFYCPLIDDSNKIIGVFTIQSHKKNIFKDFNFDILTSLETYLNMSLNNIVNYDKLQISLNNEREFQAQLSQNERLLELVKLTAGIAHEIKNPLNFILNFSELSNTLIGDIKEEIEALKDKIEDAKIFEDIDDLLVDVGINMGKIIEHSGRADRIMRNMLEHVRGGTGNYEMTDVNLLVQEYTKLAYHGARITFPNFNTKITYSLDETIGKIKMYSQSMSRVITNIVSNGCFAVNERTKISSNNQISGNNHYVPELTITTKNLDNKVLILIRDNGIGISEENLSKIFTPFFSTKKESGQGTGLGLSMCYGIVVEEHKGEISVSSKLNEFTEFKIILPKEISK